MKPPHFGRRRWIGIWPPSNQGWHGVARLLALLAAAGRLALAAGLHRDRRASRGAWPPARASDRGVSSRFVTSIRCFTLNSMPRISGLSFLATDVPIFLRPSARSVPFWSGGAADRALALGDLDLGHQLAPFSLEPPPDVDGCCWLLPSAAASSGEATSSSDRPADARDLLRTPQRLEAGDRRVDDVDRVGRPEDLARGSPRCRRTRARRAPRRPR